MAPEWEYRRSATYRACRLTAAAGLLSVLAGCDKPWNPYTIRWQSEPGQGHNVEIIAVGLSSSERTGLEAALKGAADPGSVIAALKDGWKDRYKSVTLDTPDNSAHELVPSTDPLWRAWRSGTGSDGNPLWYFVLLVPVIAEAEGSEKRFDSYVAAPVEDSWLAGHKTLTFGWVRQTGVSLFDRPSQAK